jgi:site-specific DNA-methyltransferase (adenine-specific)
MRVQETLANRHEEAKLDKAVFDRATMLLHKGDAREWLKTIPDNSVDLVNFDPPWGDNVSHKVDPEFDDSTEYAQSLMDACLPEIYRVLKNDRFCIFWHRSWITETMRSYAHSFGFNTTNTKTACIWYKPEKISDENRIPEKQLIEAYEPFYLLRKGDPIFYERMANNVFAYNRVSLGALIHPTEKPLELCSDLIRLTTVPGEVVLDPTAGSSAFLEAALRSSRKAKGCELSNKYYERGITRLAEYLKTYKEN